MWLLHVEANSVALGVGKSMSLINATIKRNQSVVGVGGGRIQLRMEDVVK